MSTVYATYTAVMFIALCLASPNLLADEKLVYAGCVVKDTGTFQQIVEYDPIPGMTEVWTSADPKDKAAALIKGPLLDIHGSHLIARAVGTDDNTSGTRFTIQTSQPSQDIQSIDEVPMGTHVYPCSRSPDGATMIVFDANGNILYIAGPKGLYRIPVSWGAVRSFSWNRRGTHVTFYYAYKYVDDDIHIQHHGLAVLSLTGDLQEVVSQASSNPTPDSNGKYVRPGWSPSGDRIYYTDGLAPSSPMAELANSHIFPPFVACCVDVASKEREHILLGEFADISPDGRYILVYPSPKPGTGKKKSPWHAAQVDLDSRSVTYLPQEVQYPKISPSGKLAACIGVRFFSTSDWHTYGKPVSGVGSGIEYWHQDVRWVITEGQVASTQSSE